MSCGLHSFDVRNVNLPLCMPKIIFGLHPDPRATTPAEEGSKTHGNGWGDGLLFGENVIEGLTRDLETTRDLGLAEAARGQDILAQHFTGVGRAVVAKSDRGLGHGHCSLMGTLP